MADDIDKDTAPHCDVLLNTVSFKGNNPYIVNPHCENHSLWQGSEIIPIRHNFCLSAEYPQFFSHTYCANYSVIFHCLSNMTKNDVTTHGMIWESSHPRKPVLWNLPLSDHWLSAKQHVHPGEKLYVVMQIKLSLFHSTRSRSHRSADTQSWRPATAPRGAVRKKCA